MFQLFRQPERGEFVVVFGDCAQGGDDSNVVQFLSTNRNDVFMKLKMGGVAAGMTPFLIQALQWVHKQTGVKPVVALERNNGGASEMHNLMMQNDGSYTVYQMKTEGLEGGEKIEPKLGWDTNVESRPRMLGEYKVAFDGNMVIIYSKETIDEHSTFIVNKNGKPEANAGSHDDEVMSMAGVWQLKQTERPPVQLHQKRRRGQNRLNLHVG